MVQVPDGGWAWFEELGRLGTGDRGGAVSASVVRSGLGVGWSGRYRGAFRSRCAGRVRGGVSLGVDLGLGR